MIRSGINGRNIFLLELYRKGLSRETILTLYEFIGVIMALPQVKDEALYDEIEQTSEEKQMSVLAVAERVGLKKGLKQTISDILEIKFGVVGLELLEQVELITDIDVLEKIRGGLKQARSIAEAEAVIRARVMEQSEEPRA
jgi:hypothetical protein